MMETSDMDDLITVTLDSIKKKCAKGDWFVDMCELKDYSIMEKYMVKRKWYSRMWRKFKGWFV